LNRSTTNLSSAIDTSELKELLAASRIRKLSRKNLHNHRKTIKRLRNLLTVSGSTSCRAVVKALAHAKDAIGEWHDWEQLLHLAEENLGHGKGCRLLASLRAVEQDKLQQALRTANKLRKSHLSSSESIRALLAKAMPETGETFL